MLHRFSRLSANLQKLIEKLSQLMSSSPKSSDSVLEQLLKNLQGKSTPSADCPLCSRKGAVVPIPDFPEKWSFGEPTDYTFGLCRDCGEVCGLTVMLMSLKGDLSTTAYTFPRPLISVATNHFQTPTLSAEDIAVPPYMPARVVSLFRQARHNLLLHNLDAAGMVYRKVLEISLKIKFETNKSTLAGTIKHLSNTQPGIFILFAELLRGGGNMAVHNDQEFSKVQLFDCYIEQLLVYLFTVPEIKRQVTENTGNEP